MPASSRRSPSRERVGEKCHRTGSADYVNSPKLWGRGASSVLSEPGDLTSTHPECEASRPERPSLRDLLPAYHGAQLCACGHRIGAHAIGERGTICRTAIVAGGELRRCGCPLFIAAREALK